MVKSSKTKEINYHGVSLSIDVGISRSGKMKFMNCSKVAMRAYLMIQKLVKKKSSMNASIKSTTLDSMNWFTIRAKRLNKVRIQVTYRLSWKRLFQRLIRSLIKQNMPYQINHGYRTWEKI